MQHSQHRMEKSAPPAPPEVAAYRRWHLPATVDRAISLAVVDGDSPETQRTKRLLAGALWVSLVTSAASMYQFYLFGAPLAAVSIGVILITTSGSLLAMWLRPSTYPGVLHVIIGVSVIVSASLTVMYGGIPESGSNAVWGFLVVLGGVVIFEDVRSIFWLAFFVAVTFGSLIVVGQVAPIYVLPNPSYSSLFNLLVVLGFVFGLLFYYVRQRSALLSQSDGLLRNILPDEIADRLKTSGEMIAEDFESASILFADVAGFTPMSAEMTPGTMVALLNEIFTGFDDLVEERGLEKIKTIGDAYMVAAGVPVPRDDHAWAICDLALAMQERVESSRFQGQQIKFRIGINSGPVVAGIIGRKKFSYDLWGDAVNTASRMESTGSAGRIQTTEMTRNLAGDGFAFELGGTVEVKGKGPMEVWYLMGRRG